MTNAPVPSIADRLSEADYPVQLERWASATFNGWRAVVQCPQIDQDAELSMRGLLVADIASAPGGTVMLLVAESDAPTSAHEVAAAIHLALRAHLLTKDQPK